jgi:hypothetical protein
MAENKESEANGAAGKPHKLWNYAAALLSRDGKKMLMLNLCSTSNPHCEHRKSTMVR